MDTATSSATKRIKPSKITNEIVQPIEAKGPLTNTINICPAIILAANRTERVNGRMEILIISIITIKGINT